MAIIDAKSVYNATHSEQAQGEDDRSALEIAAIKESLSKMQGRINPADMLTKMIGAHEEPMFALLRNCRLRIEAEADHLASGRQGDHRKKSKVNPKIILGAEETT